MNPKLRAFLGVLAGLVVSWIFVMIAEAFVHKLYPPPAGTNMEDWEQVKKFVGSLPMAALLMVLGGWLLGTLLGTFTAAKIGRTAVAGYIVGTILLAAGVANSVMIPQPLWFSIASFVIYIAMTLAGSRAAAPAVRSAP
jgi:hypothetical protein